MSVVNGMQMAEATGPLAETPQGQQAFFSRQVMRGVPWTILGKLVLFFVYFGVSIVTVRSLGSEMYGAFSLYRNIIENLVIVCTLGLNTALARFIPELLVSRNQAGLFRLLKKTALLQLATVLLFAAILYQVRPYFQTWFKIDFTSYMVLLVALTVGVRLGKLYLEDAFTAFFEVRAISIMTICQGMLWLGLLALVLPRMPEISVALLVQVISVLAIYPVGVVLLTRFLRRMTWRSPEQGIGRRRTLNLALPSLLNSFANIMMRQYSEVFFLGFFFTPAIVGVYDVGVTVPLMVITFIPLAVQKLFMSGFAEAYSRDNACLGRLISTFYKALILMVVPFSAFGFFFAHRAIALMYGAEMQAAGPIAAIFFLVHTLPLISVPLSMAIVAKEKILNMQPLMLIQIAVNLTLDYLLIPRFEMQGAIAAVVGTFVLTIPLRLYVTSRIVGGIHFPIGFFLKISVLVFAFSAGLSFLAPHLGLFELFAAGAGYFAVYLVLVRSFRLLQQRDIAEVKNLGFDKLNWILNCFVAR